MFEKEAKEYCTRQTLLEDVRDNICNAFQDGVEFGYNKVKKELEEEKKLNAEIKARFVKCNTCTDEMKSKCLMFTENLCEGERCEELIDIVSLVNNSDLKRKIEELEQENTELKSGCGICYRKDKESLTKAREIILKLYNAGRDVLMCRAEEKAYDNLDEAINDRSIEQFLKE